MNVRQIRERAKNTGIKPGKLRKVELIRLIQEGEGNFPCFDTKRVENCGEENCLWREDCLKLFKS